jgi:ATP-dependent DNA helicase PIF1
MRVRNDPSELDFISWIGSLPYDPTLNGQITLPSFVQQAPSIADLINHVYPRERLLQATYDYQAFHGHAILSTLNDTVRELNTTILDTFPGEDQTYLAVDSADVNEADPEIAKLPPEVLQNICLPGLPLSKLQLKVGAPVMLLRNLCPQEGLCNGSRMSIHSLGRFSVQVRLLGGDFDGQLRTIPRIKLQSTDQQLSFTLSRKQFPLTLSFAITINKSQGQSFEAVGVDLRSPVFTHGQFYVAASRVTSKAGLVVLLPPDVSQTSNIVYPEILQNIN